MIKVEKDFANIPTILTLESRYSRESFFKQNIDSASFSSGKDKYKVASVQKELKKIYHLKCAYCEQKLLDAPKHIEHYRPKDIYYWLAYSWDNLLLCCGSCNSSKGTDFATENNQVVYNNETFENIHTLGNSYDEIENPKIINPEKEDVLDLIVFDTDGKISSEDERVHHTIEEACNLNRDELVQLRMLLITDFTNRMKEHYLYFSKNGDISRFKPDVENFIQNCKKENEFYAFRYFVSHNIEIFFADNKPLQSIAKGLFSKLC